MSLYKVTSQYGSYVFVIALDESGARREGLCCGLRGKLSTKLIDRPMQSELDRVTRR